MINHDDNEKLRELRETRQRNNEISWMLFDYLNNNPSLITKELIEQMNGDGDLPEETLFAALLTGFFSLDTETSARDRQMANDYLRGAVRHLDSEVYAGNPYFRDIRIPEVTYGNWELTYERFRPYEAFIYNEPVVEPDFKEIPRIGFFAEEFRFPVLLENGHEWMAIKPNEIETMQPPLDRIEGRVVTFGLGLGYFTYMASLKEKVERITVVERDPDVILLFEKYILPQFQHKEKVEIISADAFEFIEKEMQERHFDFAFADLWHDVSDGLDMYLRMKKLEHQTPRTEFLYWIEDTLLSGFRSQLFDQFIENAGSFEEAVKWLEKPFLQKFASLKE